MKFLLKTLLFISIALLPFFGKAQANLGYSASDIENLHPDNSFKTAYTDQGQQYIYSTYPLGTFFYYINTKSGISDMCLQVPNNMADVNTQVQIYNRSYVITSDTTWKAYLDGGSIMYIKLHYDDSYKAYSFLYTNYYQ